MEGSIQGDEKSRKFGTYYAGKITSNTDVSQFNQ